MKQARQACKPARHPLALAVASALALVSLPAAAQSSQWHLGSHPVATENAHINTTQINFGGHEWVVIGNSSKDIYQGSHDGGTYGHANADANSVTLLSRNGDEGGGFGNSTFRTYLGGGSGGCASGDYAGTCITRPNEYQGSTLQGAMNAIAGGLGKELGVINARDLESIGDIEISSTSELNSADGINGADAGGQMLWALSFPEWRAIAYGIGDSDGTAVRSYGTSSWWLRSPASTITTPLPVSLAAASSATTTSILRRMLSAPLSI
ncbi:hypothetical protein AGMMS50225_20750 [Betaproteobacteria bacterium]|nr:hypothetical protein AGMMS50225_20750 [Betaproteobacteria bacterium]